MGKPARLSRPREQRRRRLTLAVFVGTAFSGLLCTSPILPLANRVMADQPLGNAIFTPANRVARFLGMGYSDGYHAAAGRSNNALLDLPPASAYEKHAGFGNQRQAMFPLPSHTYHLHAPTWVNDASHTSPAFEAAPQPANSNPEKPPITYPVQPAVPPESPYQSIPNLTLPPTPSGNQQLDTYNKGRNGNRIDIAPKPDTESISTPRPQQSPASPSDLLSDPPKSKFFEDNPTQKLLDGLEQLGEESLTDPLMDDATIDRDGSLENDNGRENILLPETPTGTDFDLKFDLENLELPPATGGENDLLNTRYRQDHYHPSSPNQYTPAPRRTAQHGEFSQSRHQNHAEKIQTPRQATSSNLLTPAEIPTVKLTAPANGRSPHIHEPTGASPAVIRSTQSSAIKQPRTARRIYEPQRQR